MSLIEQARAANVHEVLGYRSWTEYVAEKFGGLLARIGKAERLPIVELLSGQGMSTRAIGTVIGVSKDTVSRDLRPGVSDETPEVPPKRQLRPDEIDGLMSAGLIKDLDDLEHCLAMGDAADDVFEAAITEARADDDLSAENVAAKVNPITKAATSNVIGIDGKSYARPAPAAPRRRPLPDQARDAGWDLYKSAERIQRILADDRLAANREQVCHALRRHLRHTQDAVRDALDLLPRDEAGVTDPYWAAIEDLDSAVQRFERVDRQALDEARWPEVEPVPRQHLEQLRKALQQVADDLGEWWSAC